MSGSTEAVLRAELNGLQLEDFDGASRLLVAYAQDIARWSSATGVSGFDNPAAVATELIVPAVRLAPVVERLEATRVLDIGAGSGAGSLPLALLVPRVCLTCLEVRRKAAVFIEHAARRMGLQVTVAVGRAESLADDPSMRHRFDLTLCRAVGPLTATITWAEAFASPGGSSIFWRPPSRPLDAGHFQHGLPRRPSGAPERLALGPGLPVDAWLVRW
jgi:16S rRNA G527 N7-methylase RsmG